MHASRLKNQPSLDDKKRVLTKAIIRLSERLEINRRELCAIIGTSESSLSRIFNHTGYIDPVSNEGRLAILLLRLYKAVDGLFGGNVYQSQTWLRSENKSFHGKPIDLIQSIDGLMNVIQYLDAMRGKN